MARNMRGMRGKVEGHVELVAVAEVGTHLGRPLVRLGEEDTALVAIVDLAPDLAEERVGLGQALAVGAVALEEIGDGIAAESVKPPVQPELHGLENLAAYGRIVQVEIGLMMEEAVPVVRLGHRIPRPVRGLGVREDDPRVPVSLVGVVPHVVVVIGRIGSPPGRLEPRVLVGGVIHDEIGDDPDAVGMRRLEKALEVGHGAVLGMDGPVVRHVVAVVTQG
jgi:hypothetical protein